MKIKIYKKFELAKLYFPEQSKHVALNHLMRMVNHCPPLLEALRREGYVTVGEDLHHAPDAAHL